MKTVYILGNSLLPADRAAADLLPILRSASREWRFVRHDPTDELDLQDADPVFIDTVHGIQRVTVFRSLVAFARSRTTTVHDYDLVPELGILLKLGRISSVTIVGIPKNAKPGTVLPEVQKALRSLTQEQTRATTQSTEA